MSDELSVEDEERWCTEQREALRAHFASEGIAHGEISDWPAWHVAGVIGVWPVQSKKEPQYVGWWAIAGDGPTEILDAESVETPREALREVATRWLDAGEALVRGETPERADAGSPEEWSEFGEMLVGRAETLLEWCDDDELWSE